MRRIQMAMLAGLTAAAMAVGCGGKGGGGAGGKTLSKEERADRKLATKLTPYIELSNKYIDEVRKSKRRYFSWLSDPKAGPTCKERHLYGLYKITPTGKLAEKIQTANEEEPRLKVIEDNAVKMLVALDKLEPLARRAKRYYDQKDYKDDDCKKGQELHGKLIRTFGEFEAAEKAVSAALRKQTNALHARRLKAIEKKYGKDHQRYYHKKVALDAREVLGLLKEGQTDPGKVGPKVEALDKLIQEMDKNASKGKAPLLYGSFRSQANSFIKVVKVRVRAVRDGKVYSKWDKKKIESGSGWMVRGSYAKCVYEFNRLIDNSNRVRYR